MPTTDTKVYTDVHQEKPEYFFSTLVRIEETSAISFPATPLGAECSPKDVKQDSKTLFNEKGLIRNLFDDLN